MALKTALSLVLLAACTTPANIIERQQPAERQPGYWTTIPAPPPSEFAFRQVWALPPLLAPGEVEILCLYNDGTSAAVHIYDAPAPEDLPFDTFNSSLVRITLDALRDSALEYRGWRGSPDGGDPPLFDCATPEFQAMGSYDKPIADLLQEVAAQVRAERATEQ